MSLAVWDGQPLHSASSAYDSAQANSSNGGGYTSPAKEPEQGDWTIFQDASHEPTQLQMPNQYPGSQALSLLPADPLMNTLQLTRTTVFAASLRNAICLGLDLIELCACQTNCMSPFYRPMCPQDDPKALIASVSNSAIPANLRPTLAQIMIPHHAYIDLLPFPLLRERAIMLSAALPSRFNLWELKLDIYVRNAMVCWQRKDGGGSQIGGCQPWDMKSWEVAPWFLAKWCVVVDGEDGEIGKQSSWWRAVKGVVDGALGL